MRDQKMIPFRCWWSVISTSQIVADHRSKRLNYSAHQGQQMEPRTTEQTTGNIKRDIARSLPFHNLHSYSKLIGTVGEKTKDRFLFPSASSYSAEYPNERERRRQRVGGGGGMCVFLYRVVRFVRNNELGYRRIWRRRVRRALWRGEDLKEFFLGSLHILQ